ncbi:MAG: methyltransferase domain-containing protein [Betaproteobacteria bacterium]|nr:methyltransferase domain-containing protein [Betaproteobacteria bacterium]
MSTGAPRSAADKPDHQRPEHPDFWCKRFAEGTTPWDAGGVPPEFAAFAARQPAPLATLIPGCGSAWEAAHLARLGWQVTALDFSAEAVARARTLLGDAAVDLACADFFTWQPIRTPELLYERAFLCALPRKLWDDWGRRVADLLPPGGLLAGYFFVCDQVKGPPFGILADQLDALLAPAFKRIEDAAAKDSIAAFAGRERWQVWQRR